MPTASHKFHIVNEAAHNRRGVFLWRYFDLHKFYSFLRNREIRFTKMDEFEDPMEGVPLRALITYAEERDLELIKDDKLSDLILDNAKFRKLSVAMQGRIKTIKNIQQSSFVSCWFLGKRESMAMWNLYSNADGVAVKISASSLFKHFKEVAPSIFELNVTSFYGGKVDYQDFKTIDAEDDSATVPKVALRKDISYKHEEEFRFVIRTKNGAEAEESFTSRIEDLGTMNLKVVCHPLMPKWKRDNIMQMLNDAKLEKAFSLSEIRLRKR